jgi:DNA-binding SARP family transcriptional activator
MSVRLFGGLSIERNGNTVDGLTGSKVQELFCYLLLQRGRPHPREALASLLWADSPTAQSKKYLRQALWQLQSALKGEHDHPEGRVCLIDTEWVRLNSAAHLWLDVAQFESVALLTRGVPSEQLDATSVEALQTAAALYRGDLLEGRYQDWCLRERERLQGIYLTILDKLMTYCEAHAKFEAGMQYGSLSLHHDRARECTHQRLMRLHYLADDRAAALRQYERCVVALDDELGVKPSERTLALYDEIRAGTLNGSRPAAALGAAMATGNLTAVLERLGQLEDRLVDMQCQVRAEIDLIHQVAGGPHGTNIPGRRPPLRKVAELRERYGTRPSR